MTTDQVIAKLGQTCDLSRISTDAARLELLARVVGAKLVYWDLLRQLELALCGTDDLTDAQGEVIAQRIEMLAGGHPLDGQFTSEAVTEAHLFDTCAALAAVSKD